MTDYTTLTQDELRRAYCEAYYFGADSLSGIEGEIQRRGLTAQDLCKICWLVTVRHKKESDPFGKPIESMSIYELECAITYMLHRSQFAWQDIQVFIDRRNHLQHVEDRIMLAKMGKAKGRNRIYKPIANRQMDMG